MAPLGTAMVTLDKLPLKRALALEENGAEILPLEPNPEDKPLHLLSRIDFGQTVENDTKKSKVGKDSAPAAPAVWQWQGVVDNLQQAHQELNIILDLISHVEANEAVQVASMTRPKLLPSEAFNELSLRGAVKNNKFREVGRYLKRTAQALERQVEREAVFYGALMRLQRNWKVKRNRGVSAGPGGSAGFGIDLSLPLSPDLASASSARAAGLALVSLDQDTTGLLQALAPAGKAMNKLNISLRTTLSGRMAWKGQDVQDADKFSQTGEQAKGVEGTGASQSRGVGEGVDTGAKVAQTVLRRVQAVLYDEQVFKWVGREALLPNSGMNVLGIGDTCLQFSLGHSASLTLELSESAKANPEGDSMNTGGGAQVDVGNEIGDSLSSVITSETIDQTDSDWSSLKVSGRCLVPSERSLVVCLHQAFHQYAFGFPIVLPDGQVTFKLDVRRYAADTVNTSKSKEALASSNTATGKDVSVSGSAIRHFSAIMRHRVVSNRVTLELERQVLETPHLQLYFHPTWHPRVSAWNLSLLTPLPPQSEKDKDKTEVWFHCTVVLRDESLTVEGLEGEPRFEAPSRASPPKVVPLRSHHVGISELPMFLLFLIASELVAWLHEEAVNMGLKAIRDLLSVVLELETSDDIAIVACPDVKAHCINWWMRTSGVPSDDGTGKEDMCSENGHHQRFLGPMSLDVLRNVLLDLVTAETVAGNLE